MPLLTRASVEGLLDEFDHDFEFPPDWNFLILYGPNGVGKTKLLELVAFVLRGEYNRVATVPFRSLELDFDGHARLRVGRIVAPTDANPEAVRISGELVASDGKLLGRWEFVFDHDLMPANLRRHLIEDTSWRPISSTMWEDMDDGEIVEEGELASRYTGRPLSRATRSEHVLPELVREFLDQSPSYLISTQRLLATAPRRARRSATTSKISEYGENLKRRLSAALAENSRTSQDLDRSFPSRILAAPEPDIEDTEIRRRYAQQSELRRELTEIGLLRPEYDVPIPEQTLEPWERTVLKTYLDDSDRKLGTFSEVLARVKLLRDIINRRFLYKQLDVSLDRGLYLSRRSGGAQFSAEDLSSGEQHELVLFYDLLFNVPPAALVLIDEPEISLHVAWQKNFVNDISQIAELVSLRFVIATHSPQIINKSWDRARGLGPTEEFDL